MNKKIFISSFTMSISVLLVSITMIIPMLFRFFELQLQKELKNEATYISYGLENEGISYLENFKSESKRITLIGQNGSVIFDNKADISLLDNHSDRAEIKQAMDIGVGISLRYSNTLTEKTIYYAIKLSNAMILRVSLTQHTIIAILIYLMPQFIGIVLIAFILSFILSAWFSKSIIKPINCLDLNEPENNVTYEELTPLLSKIARQKQIIEQQLKEAQKRQEEFHMITENMKEGFLVIDQRAVLLSYNSSALKLLGIEKEVDGNVLTLNRTKDFREAVTTALLGKCAKSIMTYNGRYYHLIANPVLDDDKVVGAIIMIMDSTESVKREQLRREFTANISHELKTPLTSISGFAELMKLGGTPEEMVIDFSTSIYDEAQRLISVVTDVIKISELDEKDIQYEEETVDLHELSKEIIERLYPETRKKNIHINLLGEKVTIKGVKKILSDIIFNLCENAIKYNKENGTVTITTQKVDYDKVILKVSDTGIGIPLECQSQVFERFYRVDKSHSKKIGGTGLGLSIVKHGALYHHANITLESVEGKGTSITITFKK